MIQLRSFFLAGLLMTFITNPVITGDRIFIRSGSQVTLSDNKAKQSDTIKIGLLIPDKEALAAKHGAELAIRKAKRRGGYSHLPFQLVVRSTEGQWGAGSKESVRLVFEDEVVAIMGSLDGRNAHLAEQVAATTKILFLSSWAPDMTISLPFVPWSLRWRPNHQHLAMSLFL